MVVKAIVRFLLAVGMSPVGAEFELPPLTAFEVDGPSGGVKTSEPGCSMWGNAGIILRIGRDLGKRKRSPLCLQTLGIGGW